jgi:hypothetical protein
MGRPGHKGEVLLWGSSNSDRYCGRCVTKRKERFPNHNPVRERGDLPCEEKVERKKNLTQRHLSGESFVWGLGPTIRERPGYKARIKP